MGLPTTNPLLSGFQPHPGRWSDKLLELFEISSQKTNYLPGFLAGALSSPILKFLGKIPILWGSVVSIPR